MVEFIRLIGHQVGIVIGRLDQHGLTGGAQGLELILEPNAIAITANDVGEPFCIAKGARGAGATVVVGFAARLLNIEYKCHGLHLQRYDPCAMELGHAQCRRDRVTICRSDAAARKDGQTIARILD